VSGAVVNLVAAQLSDTTDQNGDFVIYREGTTGLRQGTPEQMQPAYMRNNALHFFIDRTDVHIHIALFNLAGREIAKKEFSIQDPGPYALNPFPPAIGKSRESVYLVRLEFPGAVHYFKLLNIHPSTGYSLERQPSGRQPFTLAKQAAVIDTLTVSKDGYEAEQVLIEDYIQDLGDIMLTSTTPADTGFPNTSNTGPSDPSLLQPSGDIRVTEDGTIIENVDVDGFIEVDASNVTIRNFRISTNTYWGIRVTGGTNILIEDGEIDGNDYCHDGVTGSNYTIRRVYLHNMGGDSFKAGSNCMIGACLIRHIGQGDGAHGDGVQMMGGTDITIINNNFDLTTGSLTACVFPGGGGTVYNIMVDGNRLTGGSYTIYCNEYMTVRNNVFGRDHAYGIRTNDCAEWSGNIWEDTGEEAP
jgi:uncharacterized protein YdeI (BOF family)